MATKSFNEGLEIRDEKAALALIKVFDEKDSHKPINVKDFSRDRESGQSFVRRRYFR